VHSVVDEGISSGRGFDDDEAAQLVLYVEEPASVSVDDSR
jgi:hypothetical protein